MVTMAGSTARTGRAAETRELIAAAAERLFAEHGVAAVSNRQISEAAGQGNNAAVGYHFGSRAGLVRAIVRRHAEPTELVRRRLLAGIGDSPELRDWVDCLVRPIPEHLAMLGSPSWYARFAAQVMTDPVLRAVTIDAGFVGPALRRTLDGLGRCIPALPRHVRAERADMARHLITHTCAEREGALADGSAPLQASWEHTAIALTDAITGLLSAPVTSAFTPRPSQAEGDPAMQTRTLKITVDDLKCCGAGQCAILAPEVFDQREDDGIVILLDAEPPEELHAAVREAASMCPTATIRLGEGA